MYPAISQSEQKRIKGPAIPLKWGSMATIAVYLHATRQRHHRSCKRALGLAMALKKILSYDTSNDPGVDMTHDSITRFLEL